jgi:uroporphyrinogen III methyltransferase/synthase
VCAAELKKPLEGKRVLVTRAEGQSGEAADLLRHKGAEPVLVPTIAFGPPQDRSLAEDAVRNLAAYDWVAFTSQNGVERTLELLPKSGLAAQAFGSARVAAVGPATARALTRAGIAVHLVAKESQGEGLAREMLAVFQGPKRVILLRAQVAREALPDALRAAGCKVDIVPVYATYPAPDLEATLTRLFAKGPPVAAALFSSSSTVTQVCNALKNAPELLQSVVVATIGPATTETAKTRGLRVDLEASPHTVPALIEALEAFFAQKGPLPPPFRPR